MVDHISGASQTLERGWCLSGSDDDNQSLRLVVGETALRHSYLGLTIGRHPDLCELVLEDVAVSHRHARLSYTADGLAVEDLHSLNGTYIEGLLLEPFQLTLIHPGQYLGLGRIDLLLETL